MLQNKEKDGFTIIELLVVVLIIAVLVGLMFPMMISARSKAKIYTVKKEISFLDAAFREYLVEYRNPNKIKSGINELTSDGIEIDVDIVNMLRGGNSLGNNPKKIRFYDVSDDQLSNIGEMLDPWGNPYKVMFDYDGDGAISVLCFLHSGRYTARQPVCIWSRGPNPKEEGSGLKDNICNWHGSEPSPHN